MLLTIRSCGWFASFRWQTDNIIEQLDPATFKMLAARLAEVARCKGAVCPGHGQ